MANLASVNLFADDLDRLVAFYTGLFGFRELVALRSPIFRAVEAGAMMIAINGPQAYELLGLADQAAVSGLRSFLTVDVRRSELDELVVKAVRHGAVLVKPPYETAYGARQAMLRDPAGHGLRLSAFEA